jgi:hypothetical protein
MILSEVIFFFFKKKINMYGLFSIEEIIKNIFIHFENDYLLKYFSNIYINIIII